MKHLLLATSLFAVACTPFHELSPEDQQSQINFNISSAIMARELAYQQQLYYQPVCYTRPWGIGYQTTCR